MKRARNLAAFFHNILTQKQQAYELDDIDISDENLESAFVSEDSVFRVFGEMDFKKIGMLFNKTESWVSVTHYYAAFRFKKGWKAYEISVRNTKGYTAALP